MRLFLLVILFVASNVADGQIYVKSFSKENTGTYFVQLSETGGPMPSTGVMLEIFDPGERLTPGGARLDRPFVFGTYYTDDGGYVVFNGTFAWDNYATVTISQVYRDDSGETRTEAIGGATLLIDPLNNGQSDLIRFNGVIDGQRMIGFLVKASDRVIRNCVSPTGSIIECLNQTTVNSSTPFVPSNTTIQNVSCVGGTSSSSMTVSFDPIPSLYRFEITHTLLSQYGTAISSGFGEVYTPARGAQRPSFVHAVALGQGERVRYRLRLFGKGWSRDVAAFECGSSGFSF